MMVWNNRHWDKMGVMKNMAINLYTIKKHVEKHFPYYVYGSGFFVLLINSILSILLANYYTINRGMLRDIFILLAYGYLAILVLHPVVFFQIIRSYDILLEGSSTVIKSKKINKTLLIYKGIIYVNLLMFILTILFYSTMELMDDMSLFFISFTFTFYFIATVFLGLVASFDWFFRYAHNKEM